MRRTALILIAAAAFAAPVSAQTVTYGVRDIGPVWPTVPRGGLVPDDGGAGLNAFFYPDGYDPQYGSEGRLADAGDFAAGYGCQPVWDGKYGQYVEACNR